MHLLNENKKYRLTKRSITLNNGLILYRIKALKDFGDVRKGQLGGYVQSEANLSQNGECWIYDKATIYDDAKLKDNVKIFDNVKVHAYATVGDNAHIYHDVDITEHACIYDYTTLCDQVCVMSNAILNCHTYINTNAIIKDNHDYYSGYIDSRHKVLNRTPITIFYTPKREVRVVYKEITYNLQGFIDEVRKTLGYISYAEDFRPQLVNARRRMYFKDII